MAKVSLVQHYVLILISTLFYTRKEKKKKTQRNNNKKTHIQNLVFTYPAPNIALPMLSIPQPHPKSAIVLFSISSKVLWIV